MQSVWPATILGERKVKMVSPHDKDAVIIPVEAHQADVELHEFCKRMVPLKAYEFVHVQSYDNVIIPRATLLTERLNSHREPSAADIAEAVWGEASKL